MTKFIDSKDDIQKKSSFYFPEQISLERIILFNRITAYDRCLERLQRPVHLLVR